ncbi:MAG: homogentisate 1,2-dioxygenase [Alphaproteobacteria bacterium]
MSDTYSYMSGFGNEFASEALEGALPAGQNLPQKAPYGLYPEQLTGSPFTAPLVHNKRSWLYRIRPSVVQPAFSPVASTQMRSSPFNEQDPTPNQLRWDPIDIPKKPTDFIEGLITIAGNGDTHSWSGLGVHLYACNTSMSKTGSYFYNADGEMLFVPQEGAITARTEMGVLRAEPSEIIVIPRGVKFAIDVEGPSRGYICENYGQPFTIPDRGPIGANGLANQRDFLSPVASYEDEEGSFELIAKFAGKLWRTQLGHSPLDVVAWHGNYAPYKYDLKRFNTINTVSFDHPDPSIFTVLTSPSSPCGTANIDFVIFPPRWMVAENTFRPPYFHRNLMSEFMGMISGVYDGKESGGFAPGGCSLHNCMSAHGPDSGTFKKASEAELKPHYLDSGLAFMFESRYIMCPTKAAMGSKHLQKGYNDVWKDMPKMFDGKTK